MVANASILYFLLKNVFSTCNIHIKVNVLCAYCANGFEKCLLIDSRPGIFFNDFMAFYAKNLSYFMALMPYGVIEDFKQKLENT